MNRTRTRIVLAVCTVAALGCASASSANGPRGHHGRPDGPDWASGQAYRGGVVSVANPYGAAAGAEILRKGGNAVDAAVAIAYALNVVEPQSAGIGGGGFMMIHVARTGKTVVIDSRERAPAAATRDMFVGGSNSTTNGVAVGVPGMVRGTALALKRYGTMRLAEVMEPAIELADDGFAATERYVDASCSSRARNYPETEAYFCPGGVSRVAVGEIVTNTPLAATFRTIARRGPDAFYTGDIARGIIEGQLRTRPVTPPTPPGLPGRMTYEDLRDYEPTVREPVVATYRGYTIESMPSPSSGGLTVLQMLKMLERFPLNNELTDFNTTPSINPYTGESGTNDVSPNKRPRSSMAPTIIFKNGRPLVALGSPGGATIINSVLQVTMNLIDHGMNIQEAIDAPRISVTGRSTTGNSSVQMEPGFPQVTYGEMAVLGHRVTAGSGIGSVQVVFIDPEPGHQFYGAADARREGTVIGLTKRGYGHGHDRDDDWDDRWDREDHGHDRWD